MTLRRGLAKPRGTCPPDTKPPSGRGGLGERWPFFLRPATLAPIPRDNGSRAGLPTPALLGDSPSPSVGSAENPGRSRAEGWRGSRAPSGSSPEHSGLRAGLLSPRARSGDATSGKPLLWSARDTAEPGQRSGVLPGSGGGKGTLAGSECAQDAPAPGWCPGAPGASAGRPLQQSDGPGLSLLPTGVPGRAGPRPALRLPGVAPGLLEPPLPMAGAPRKAASLPS